MDRKRITFKPRSLMYLGLGLLLSACASGALTLSQPTATPVPLTIEDNHITAEGQLMPARSTVVGFLANGELFEILVNEGDRIREGEVLATLGGRESLGAALGQAKLELLAAEQALDDLLASVDMMRTQSAQALVEAQTVLMEAQKTLDYLSTDAYQQELDDRNKAIEDAQEDLDEAREELDEHLDLDPDHATRKNAQDDYNASERALIDAIYDRDFWLHQRDQAQAAVDLAKVRVDQAQSDVDLYAGGVDPTELELAQTRLNTARSQVAAAQGALDKTKVKAPFDATVVDVNDLEPGAAITPDIMIALLADYTTWTAETRDLTELDVVNVTVGQDVAVTPDALPDLELAGVVESIDLAFTERSGDILYTVHIRLDEVDPRLRWGMTVTVSFKP